MDNTKLDLTQDVFTDESFESMGWHDCKIHSIAFFPEKYEIAFDVDFILEWVKPSLNETHFNLLIAPATLVFHNVNEAKFDLEPFTGVNIDLVTKYNSRQPKNLAYLNQKKAEWQWHIECREGEISFYSVGFSMFLRKPPEIYPSGFPTSEERGGISFVRQSYASNSP